MHIVVLQRLDQAGGGSRASLLGTIRALLELRPGWKVTLVTENTGPLAAAATATGAGHLQFKLPRFRKPLERLVFPSACRRIADTLKPLKPDVIISNEWVTAPHAGRIASLLDIPSASWVRDFAAIDRGKKYHLHRMDRLLCVCESMRDGLVAAGYDPAKTAALYNPVLAPPATGPGAGAPDGGPRLLYVAKISARKNQIAAVEVLRHLRSSTGENWSLVLAGDSDPDYERALDEHLEQSGLFPFVRKTGHVSDPGSWYRTTDASILTSEREGLARVLIESFLCGKPGFAFPIEGITDVYGDATDRFVPKTLDPTALASTIADAFADRALLENTVNALSERLAARHSLEGHVSHLEALLAETRR